MENQAEFTVDFKRQGQVAQDLCRELALQSQSKPTDIKMSVSRSSNPPKNNLCQGRELENARQQHGLPPGGIWFWTQALALEHAIQSDGLGSVTVAWDKKSDKKK